ncbi:sugar-binding domain-containing protein, partial [uncultured Chitinophaga sp.]|uniref:sugar-binding domain-containing protein n=1 Tax=uncultured Chitinophaga sp. TaxID=339340 RepID=UPI00345B704C
MKKILTLSLLTLAAFANAQEKAWKVVPGKISTSWSEQVNPAAPLPEYPRPQFVRSNWKNLNGLWDYAITGMNGAPSAYQGKILVPFAVESAISGVGRTVGKDSLLWYRTSFAVPSAMKGKRILLHFGAVDWKTKVLVNGKEAGTHEGGFDPFSFDVTA